MLLFILAVALAAYVLLAYKEDSPTRNPERNCIAQSDCPADRLIPPHDQGAGFYMDRAMRGQDKLTDDGRVELTTYPAPNPSSSYRDLF